MTEFDSVSVSSFEASSLAGKLTEKAGEGWDVVAVVPTGSEITAYLKRASSATESTGSATSWDTSASSAATSSTPSEPAGWANAPDSGWSNGGGTSSWGGQSQTPAAGTPSSTSSWGSSGSSATRASAPAAASSTPAVPPGWYTDPAGRFELRYWDGSAWTEHVSRAGQQYTDPPVA